MNLDFPRNSALTREEKEFLRNPSDFDLKGLQRIWREHGSEDPSPPIDFLEKLAERFLKFGEPLLAYDVVVCGMKNQPGLVRLRQLLGLSLARSGATRGANEVLFWLYREGDRSEETLGLLARTHKDLWAGLPPGKEATEQLEKAHSYYLEAFRRNSGAYWTGINAATTACLLKEKEDAVRIANEVVKICYDLLEKLDEKKGDPYWLLATLGECALVKGDMKEAFKWYKNSFSVIKNRWGDLASTRRNAQILVREMKTDWNALAECFKIPPVVIFSGHMIDRPDRKVPRFPQVIVPRIKREIQNRLTRIKPGFAFSSAACGGDLLFLEAALDLQAEAHIVLPFEEKQFIESSVAINPGDKWEESFGKVISRANSVTTVSEALFDGGASVFDYANIILFGMAVDKKNRLETDLIPLILWDGKPGDGPGGTASMVESWKMRGYNIEIIDPRDFYADKVVIEKSPKVKKKPAKPVTNKVEGPVCSDLSHEGGQGREFAPEIKAILFADAVHFSRLKEKQIPLFIREFLGLIGSRANRRGGAPSMRNTWGDGLFFVFDKVVEAGVFALDLAEKLNSIDWTAKGLPGNLSLRIALHAGPVYPFFDPVSRRTNFLGSHVNRAARIEPVTPPGQVYASEAFAAISLAEGTSDFSCDYVGRIPLAKSFGTFPMYHLRRIPRKTKKPIV